MSQIRVLWRRKIWAHKNELKLLSSKRLQERRLTWSRNLPTSSSISLAVFGESSLGLIIAQLPAASDWEREKGLLITNRFTRSIETLLRKTYLRWRPPKAWVLSRTDNSTPKWSKQVRTVLVWWTHCRKAKPCSSVPDACVCTCSDYRASDAPHSWPALARMRPFRIRICSDPDEWPWWYAFHSRPPCGESSSAVRDESWGPLWSDFWTSAADRLPGEHGGDLVSNREALLSILLDA